MNTMNAVLLIVLIVVILFEERIRSLLVKLVTLLRRKWKQARCPHKDLEFTSTAPFGCFDGAGYLLNAECHDCGVVLKGKDNYKKDGWPRG